SDIPTIPHGGIDLAAFSNIHFDEATEEDHLAIIGKIRLSTEEELNRFTELRAGAVTIPLATSTPIDLDTLTEAIENIQTAALAVGRRPKRHPRRAPW
ncbi:hypothetical protein TOPH_08232, partial [Tolypocladium ophioglossoides CBS 100239]